VDHVRAGQAEGHPLTHRQSYFIRQFNGLPRIGPVAHSPPPLLTRHIDTQGDIFGGAQLRHQHQPVDQQASQNHDGENDPATDDQPTGTADTVSFRVCLGGIQGDAHHHQPDDQRTARHPPEQRGDALRAGTSGVQRRLLAVAPHQHRTQQQQQQADATRPQACCGEVVC